MSRTSLVVFLLFLACNRSEAPQSGSGAAPQQPSTASPAAATSIGGDVEKGKTLVVQHGCNVCHAMPGIEGGGRLGPTLAGVASKPTISYGAVQNTPENLVKYILNPPAMNPQSAMPALGLPEQDVRDMTAFLLTLR